MYKYYILFYAIIYDYCTVPVTALSAAGIVGGLNATKGTLTYQVSIAVKNNYCNTYMPICGGGVIGKYLVISAAHCFIDENGNFDNVTFTVTVGTIDLSNTKNKRINVRVIYMLPYDPNTSLNDIAVLKLTRAVNIGTSHYLRLPNAGQSFAREIAIASGFGYNTIEMMFNNVTQEHDIPKGESDLKLKYGKMKIMSDYACVQIYPGDVTPEKEFCGLMKSDGPRAPIGTCSGDSGSPIVLNNDTIVGLIIKSGIDCDDSIRPGIHLKTSAYTKFIHGVMTSSLTNDTLVFRILRHTRA